MLTLAVIRPPERVVDHFAAVHRYGSAAQAGLDLAALVARARHRGKAPAAVAAVSSASPPTRATGC